MINDVRIVMAMVDSMVGTEKFSYPARQNRAPRPTGEFAHIRLLEEYQVSIPSQSIKSQTDTQTVFRQTSVARLRFRIGVVETDGLAASKIMHGWTSETMKAIMLETGYGFIKVRPLSNEDAKLEKEWEYRIGFSLELYVTRVYEETVDNIAQTRISGEFVDERLETYLLDIPLNET